MQRGRVWSNEAIVAAIRARARAGESLAPGATRKASGRLLAAATYHFGTWRAAVEAAGFDYHAILALSKQATVRRRREKGFWDTARVLAAIRATARAGKPLNSLAVQNEDGGLVAAAIRHVGSWARAVELATGRAYEEVRRNHPWSAVEVLETIRARRDRGATLRGRAVLQEANTLYTAARTHFGTWRAALQAAGVGYWGVGTFWELDRERLCAALHTWASSDRRGLPRELEGAVRRYFGGWEAALRAAGLDPGLARERSLRRDWTQGEVLAAIRERHVAGKSLLASEVRREDVRLLMAARRLFGGWRNARAQALGVPARNHRTWPPRATALTH